MARLVVYTQDRKNPNSPYDDALSYKTGDVVDIVPDGWKFRPGDLALPVTIVDVPGTPASFLSGFLTMDAGDKTLNLIAQKRANKFDLTTWQLGGSLSLANATSALSLMLVKARIPDPNAVGSAGQL